MKFGARPVKEAEGTILAHSLKATGRRIAKGTILTAGDVSELEMSGFSEVTVATLEDGDVSEDAAALAVAKALVPNEKKQGLRLSGAGAGRVNLYATSCGIVRLNAEQLALANLVDPMITIATVDDHHRTDAGTMVATIKIISYAVRATALEVVTNLASLAISVRPPVFSTATLIETSIGGEDPTAKGREAMAGRLHRMSIGLSDRVIVPHQEDRIAVALSQAPGQVLFILTGSATSDLEDVAPAALRQAGGVVTRFGMPVDPGNLLFLGRLGEKPVIGLPGCARSPALNGADWVLERIVCGEDVTSRDIAAMGVGGLLKEIPTRPMPRRSSQRDP